jgi:hypothetical protein
MYGQCFGRGTLFVGSGNRLILPRTQSVHVSIFRSEIAKMYSIPFSNPFVTRCFSLSIPACPVNDGLNMLSLSDACLYPLNSIIGPEGVMTLGPVLSFRMIAFGYVKTWVSLSIVTNGKTRHAVPRVSRDPNTWY